MYVYIYICIFPELVLRKINNTRMPGFFYSHKKNGNPLQGSCLDNPRDRGAWWAAICGVTQSQTWLKQLSGSSSLQSQCSKNEEGKKMRQGRRVNKTVTVQQQSLFHKPHVDLNNLLRGLKKIICLGLSYSALLPMRGNSSTFQGGIKQCTISSESRSGRTKGQDSGHVISEFRRGM